MNKDKLMIWELCQSLWILIELISNLPNTDSLESTMTKGFGMMCSPCSADSLKQKMKKIIEIKRPQGRNRMYM